MGNLQATVALSKLNDKLQKHTVQMNKNGLTLKDEPNAHQLY